jgi:hypothetical protein
MCEDKSDGVPICVSVAPCLGPPRRRLEMPSQRPATAHPSFPCTAFRRHGLRGESRSLCFPGSIVVAAVTGLDQGQEPSRIARPPKGLFPRTMFAPGESRHAAIFGCRTA